MLYLGAMTLMGKAELNKNLRQAQGAEDAGDFFSAAHYYKETLKSARAFGDSKIIKICKKKIVETNKKSEGAFHEFRFEKQILNKDIDRDVAPILKGDLLMVLKRIGRHPLLYPKYREVVESAKKGMPVTRSIANLSTTSPEGHLLRGGADGAHSWFMNIYEIQQGLINEIYLQRIFQQLAARGFNEENLSAYFKASGVFPERNLKIISVGLGRYFAEDFVSAIHILTPQFENVFLFISEKCGIDVIALDSGKDISTHTKTLSAGDLSSEPFQKVWGKDLCEQLKFTLFDPLGYKLRHKVAHGEIVLEECSSSVANLILYFYLVLAARTGVKEK